jgi:sugar/nucleoside kinase (ribokinase family)
MALGPSSLVIKHGEYGATLFYSSEPKGKGAIRAFRAPAMPLEEVVDPTGAGDSFAGGFFGYLASVAAKGEPSPAEYRRAMFYGSVMGSFAVERFGTERIAGLTRQQIEERFAHFRELTHLD